MLLWMLSCAACHGLTLRELTPVQLMPPTPQISQAADSVDFVWQDVGSLQVAPAHANAHSTLTLTFTANASVLQRPNLQVGSAAATFVGQAGNVWTYRYALLGSEGPLTVPVTVNANLAAGPIFLAAYAGLDFNAPQVGAAVLLPGSGSFVGGQFGASIAMTDDQNMALCRVCTRAADCGANDWQAGSLQGGYCMVAGLTCSNGASVHLLAQGVDWAGNVGSALPVLATCDTQVDSVGPAQGGGFTGSSTTAVPAAFTAFSLFGDVGAGLQRCEFCQSTQGECTGDWMPAVLSQDGTCSMPSTCSNGSTVSFTLRATDKVGNVGSTAPVQRLCDGVPPMLGKLVASRLGSSGLQLDWSASDAGAGLQPAGFRLDYGTSAAYGGSGATQGSSPLTGLQAPTVQLTGLQGCKRYSLAVRATDAVGNISAPQAVSVPQGCGNNGLLVAPGTEWGTVFASTLVVADFDRNGSLDIAGAKPSSQDMRIRFGDVDGSGRSLGTFNGANTNYPLGAGALMGMTAGDFNADGVTDLATSSYGGGINILLGSATQNVADGGMLLQNANYLAGATPVQLLAADVNGDRITDLLAVSPNDRALYTLLGTGANGQGDGHFAAARSTRVGTAWSAAVADFDADHALDVILTDSSGSDAVTFLHGNKDGTFATGVSYSATASGSAGVSSVAVGDLNSDGIADVVVTGPRQSTVSVLLGRGSHGRGNGQFAAPQDYPVAAAPSTVVLADYNSDGLVDVLLAHNAQPAVGVLLSNTDAGGHALGTLAAESTCDTGHPGPLHAGLVAADIDADGLLDAVVAVGDTDPTPASYVVALGGGLAPTPSGALLPVWVQAVGAPVHGLLSGDFTGDGVLDLVGLTPSGITLMAGDGGAARGVGTFSQASTFAGGTGVYGSVADWDMDGIPDVTYAAGNAQVSTLRGGGSNGRGSGALGSPVSVSAGAGAAQTWWTAAADLNNDGMVDLAVTDAISGAVDILLGNGQGALVALDSFSIAGYAPLYVGTADFNRDGLLDLVVSSLTAAPNNLCVMLGLGNFSGGNQSFAPCVFSSAGNGPEAMAVADLNADGIPDVAVSNYNDGSLSVLLGAGSGGRGTGLLQNAAVYPIGTHPTYVQVADLNGDRVPDLAVAFDGGVRPLTANKAAGHGTGTFTLGNAVASSGVPGGLIAADVDNDGLLDLLTSDLGGTCVDVFYGSGTYP